VEVLTDSVNPQGYIKDMRRRDPELFKGGGQIATPLSIQTSGGKQKLNCANTEGLFRLIQSIPSPKVEPLKRWLARVGKERIDKRVRGIAVRQDLTDEWKVAEVDFFQFSQSIAVRQDLTDEWKDRGARNSLEFAILTNEIMHGTFDLKVEEYKQFKGLERENLRDHMTDIELILTMLGKATTTELHRDRDSQGFDPLKKDAKDGGAVAGRTRKDIETQTGKPVISGDNFKQLDVRRQKKLNGGEE